MSSLPPRSRLAILLVGVLVPTFSSVAEDFQGSTHKLEYDEAPIGYPKAEPTDAITHLQAKILSGELHLTWDPDQGYLPSLLKELKIPISSQLLVFSKTSLQRKLISAKTPRAIYFNDDVYVGFIPGAPVLEISSADPNLGGVFYHLEQTAAYKPKFVRDADCLQCHGGNRSLGVPGHIVRSVGSDSTGEIDSLSEVSEINHCTPLMDRWAGWYVTGEHGWQNHRGNLINTDAMERQLREPNFVGNLNQLESLVDLQNYPRATSDLVAHLVLEHQAHMHNYITRISFETRIMMATYGHIRYLDRQIDAFLRYLLFTEEAPLSEPVRGHPDFTRDFSQPGPRDPKGRSLRDFDLQSRLFKHPCSFLIYSESFDQIPSPMKERILDRLWEILNGRDPSPQFARLSIEDRTAVREILAATKANLPDYWRQAPSAEVTR